MKKRYAIIVAAGAGTRMGSERVKQFIQFRGKPIVAHTISRFLELEPLPEIILVLPKEYREWWKEWCYSNNFKFRHILVSGGITRFHSVQNGAKYVERGGVVAIHDGVRPFVESSFLEELYTLAQSHRAVVPVLPIFDSMRELKGDNGESKVVNRENYRLVQTPQLFESDLFLEAYSRPYSPSFTDDASVVESLGEKIYLAPGRRDNIKLTSKEDLLYGEWLFKDF